MWQDQPITIGPMQWHAMGSVLPLLKFIGFSLSFHSFSIIISSLYFYYGQPRMTKDVKGVATTPVIPKKRARRRTRPAVVCRVMETSQIAYISSQEEEAQAMNGTSHGYFLLSTGHHTLFSNEGAI